MVEIKEGSSLSGSRLQDCHVFLLMWQSSSPLSWLALNSTVLMCCANHGECNEDYYPALYNAYGKSKSQAVIWPVVFIAKLVQVKNWSISENAHRLHKVISISMQCTVTKAVSCFALKERNFNTCIFSIFGSTESACPESVLMAVCSAEQAMVETFIMFSIAMYRDHCNSPSAALPNCALWKLQRCAPTNSASRNLTLADWLHYIYSLETLKQGSL